MNFANFCVTFPSFAPSFAMFVVVFVVVVFLSEIVFAIYTLLYIFSACVFLHLCGFSRSINVRSTKVNALPKGY